MSYFSEKIKKLRLASRYTQKEVALKIGISQGNYSSLESGKNDPSITTLKAVSDFYEEFIDTLVRPIFLQEDFTEDERIWVRNFRRLDTKDQREVARIIEMKLESYPPEEVIEGEEE